ncbi:MAG: ATP-binding protein [Eubacteriales bacterium]|nr:ATP-binding protein [Eubacteriales bacterium]
MKRKAMQQLVDWYQDPVTRMPLLVHGARQVGKTHLLKEFGQTYFESVAYFNFETNLTIGSYFESDIHPARVIELLEASLGQQIFPGKTLVIFDEIQACERALTALKYFREQAPEYIIACAGSLLGVAIHREKFSFPVGNVQSIWLHPFDFEEFLWATGKDLLAEEIRKSYADKRPLPEALHVEALDAYKRYLIIGGMPASIRRYLETGSLIPVIDVQHRILEDYVADMAKYASHSDSVKIKACFNSVPVQLAKENRKFQYRIVQRGGSAALFGSSIDWLDFAGIVLKCQRIEHGLMPVAVFSDLASFKLYSGDVGLLTAKSGISREIILSPFENETIFLGALTENYVAQQLMARGYPLYYWTSGNQAEVDFVIQQGPDVIPIEVKSGIRTRSRSLNQFVQKYSPPLSIRISAKNFGYENQIFSLPLYAVFCL